MRQLKQSVPAGAGTTALSLFVEQALDETPLLRLHLMQAFRPGSLSHYINQEKARELAGWLTEFAETGTLSEKVEQ
jgi:hypothetical protein